MATARRAMAIAVVLFDGAEELDWAGPWEVLAARGRLWPNDEVDCFTLSMNGREVRCANGLRVLADHEWPLGPPADVVVFPGGPGVRVLLGDTRIRSWISDTAASGALMTSVCTGALAYADAGILKGRPATTHHDAFQLLSELDPSIELRRGERFVDDGDVVTSAGVSAGIEMALHVVARLHSDARSAEVRKLIEFD